jgi:hypothetical protein
MNFVEYHPPVIITSFERKIIMTPGGTNWRKFVKHLLEENKYSGKEIYKILKSNNIPTSWRTEPTGRYPLYGVYKDGSINIGI